MAHVDWTCLLVDLAGLNVAESLSSSVTGESFGMRLHCVQSAAAADMELQSGNVLLQLVFARQISEDLLRVLAAFQRQVGSLPDFQAIICDDPSPLLMAGVFEFGIDKFVATSYWPREVPIMARQALGLLADSLSSEARILAVSAAIRRGDFGAVKKAAELISESAPYDFRLAQTKGKAAEVVGDYGQAVEGYAAAAGANKMYRPAMTAVGEALLVVGRAPEALDVFRSLEATNPNDAERKAMMVSAYLELRDFNAAMSYLEEATSLLARHPRVVQAQIHTLIYSDRIGEAMPLLDQLSDVGAFFAAKLNEAGIRLSQNGQGRNALALYNKAHKIVCPELRYIISLNAALACRRLKDWQLALKYCIRCESEFGELFPRLAVVKQSVVEAIKESQASQSNDQDTLFKAS